MPLRHTPLVTPGRLASPQSYRQLSRPAENEQFRAELATVLPNGTLASLCRDLVSDGAISLTGLSRPASFDRFRRVYDGEMQTKGSRGALHSYLNVATSAPLMASSDLWDLVAHPLHVLVIAYALGGPVKVIDLRAKDTQPLDIVARDNTLHLDNSPFIDEYKVVVTWTLGTTTGPSGQGLTYLPGTNRLFRNCFVEPNGSVWSDEDACIFPTADRVDEVLGAQATLLGRAEPVVVHLAGLAAPCHTIFAASRLVHHRYRTATGSARSSVMATFHRADDGDELLTHEATFTPSLRGFLLTGGSPGNFIAAIRAEQEEIVAAVDRITTQPDLVVDPGQHTLTGVAFEQWYSRQRQGVTLNGLRASRMGQHRGRDDSLHDWLVHRLLHDLQGPLNMPFFPDLKETRRRRARIWIREMSPENISNAIKAAEGHLPRIAGASGEQSVSGSIANLNALLLELNTSLSEARLTAAGAEAVDDVVVTGSLSPFIEDLLITVSWLDDTDLDSVITASAFALLAAVLATTWFALGDPGWNVTARIRREYLALMGTPSCPPS